MEMWNVAEQMWLNGRQPGMVTTEGLLSFTDTAQVAPSAMPVEATVTVPCVPSENTFMHAGGPSAFLLTPPVSAASSAYSLEALVTMPADPLLPAFSTDSTFAPTFSSLFSEEPKQCPFPATTSTATIAPATFASSLPSVFNPNQLDAFVGAAAVGAADPFCPDGTGATGFGSTPFFELTRAEPVYISPGELQINADLGIDPSMPSAAAAAGLEAASPAVPEEQQQQQPEFEATMAEMLANEFTACQPIVTVSAVSPIPPLQPAPTTQSPAPTPPTFTQALTTAPILPASTEPLPLTAFPHTQPELQLAASITVSALPESLEEFIRRYENRPAPTPTLYSAKSQRIQTGAGTSVPVIVQAQSMQHAMFSDLSRPEQFESWSKFACLVCKSNRTDLPLLYVGPDMSPEPLWVQCAAEDPVHHRPGQWFHADCAAFRDATVAACLTSQRVDCVFPANGFRCPSCSSEGRKRGVGMSWWERHVIHNLLLEYKRGVVSLAQDALPARTPWSGSQAALWCAISEEMQRRFGLTRGPGAVRVWWVKEGRAMFGDVEDRVAKSTRGRRAPAKNSAPAAPRDAPAQLALRPALAPVSASNLNIAAGRKRSRPDGGAEPDQPVAPKKTRQLSVFPETALPSVEMGKENDGHWKVLFED